MKRRLIPIDDWIENMGYYRKHVAYDETCLFRAVSEQIYNTQLFHEEIRSECVKYAHEHREEFTDLIKDWDDYFKKLTKHLVVCGNIEIQIISKRYEYDIILFDGLKFKCTNVTDYGYDKMLYLCLVHNDHYDALYKKEVIADTGFCQSIVYKVLYEKVFKMKHVDKVLNKMLYDKDDNIVLKYDENNNSEEEFLKQVSKRNNTGTVQTPFPFKIAKALDPNLYRNIEFDAWSEFRKEWRLNNWYNGDENFKVGTRCLLKYDEDFLHCYIQKLDLKDEHCNVYIEELAEYRNIDYKNLRPLPNAQPWSLPYRYATKTQNENKELKIKESNKKKTKNKKKSNGKKLKDVPNICLPHPDGRLQSKELRNEDYNNNSNLANFLGFPLNMPALEKREELIEPGTPNCLLDREIEANLWEDFQSPVNMWALAPLQSYYFPQKSFDPDGYDLPADVNTLMYFYNLGVDYFYTAWPAVKSPIYPAIQECALGHTISSQYNIYSDYNNNMTYYTREVTKETSFGLTNCRPPDFFKFDHSIGYVPVNSPNFIPCAPPPTPIAYPPSPTYFPYPPIASPMNINCTPVFGFPAIGCEIPYIPPD